MAQLALPGTVAGSALDNALRTEQALPDLTLAAAVTPAATARALAEGAGRRISLTPDPPLLCLLCTRAFVSEAIVGDDRQPTTDAAPSFPHRTECFASLRTNIVPARMVFSRGPLGRMRFLTTRAESFPSTSRSAGVQPHGQKPRAQWSGTPACGRGDFEMSSEDPLTLYLGIDPRLHPGDERWKL